jgi:hypothetical protein
MIAVSNDLCVVDNISEGQGDEGCLQRKEKMGMESDMYYCMYLDRGGINLTLAWLMIRQHLRQNRISISIKT